MMKRIATFLGLKPKPKPKPKPAGKKKTANNIERKFRRLVKNGYSKPQARYYSTM
jgi:hypothetical protein